MGDLVGDQLCLRCEWKVGGKLAEMPDFGRRSRRLELRSVEFVGWDNDPQQRSKLIHLSLSDDGALGKTSAGTGQGRKTRSARRARASFAEAANGSASSAFISPGRLAATGQWACDERADSTFAAVGPAGGAAAGL
jgi:hypothetical protein